MRELVEYFWDERTGIADYLYEDERTGELSASQKHQPMAKPEVTEELRASYFESLKYYLQTQPLYD